MVFLEKFKKDRKVKRTVLDKINGEILESGETDNKTAEETYKLWEMKQHVKLGGVPAGDLLKVVANVAITGVIVGFEASHVMNAKASRFIKTL